MKHRALGNTDIMISPLGLGTVKFGRNQGVKYPKGFDLPDDSTLIDLLALTKDLGINVLDTAPAYGTSEKRLGKLLKGQRKDWVIVGKAGEEFENGKSFYDFTPAHLERSVMRSLERLQTDYIDVLLLHSNGDDMTVLNDDTVQAMHDFKKRGLVRMIGASTKTAEGGIKALETMDAAMCMYTSEYTDEKPVLDFAAQTGQPIFLKKVLNSGHAQNPEKAFEFAFGLSSVTSAIIGTINPDHLKSNVASVNNIF